MPSLDPRTLSLLALILLSGGAPAQDPVEPPHHLVEVAVGDEAELQRLAAMDLDFASCHGPARGQRRVEVIATAEDLAVLERSGFAFAVVIRNLEEHHARELAGHGSFPDTPTPPLGQGAMGGHWTFDQAVAILDQLAADHPGLCAPKISIGKSIQGRDLWMVKISDNVGVDENESEVLYDALHHAREPLSMETTIAFMDDILSKYGTDPEATFIIDERELYFVPIVNPDGYEYNRQTDPGGGGMWRKNRRNNGGGRYGVDLNRNYATGFGGSGSSGSTRSDTYRGTAPFSEPETAALEAFSNARSFEVVFSVHTYTDVLLRPWGYLTSQPANRLEYDRVGRIATASNGLSHGSAANLLYVASGIALDHHHAVRGALSWSPELGRSSEGGFWPNPANTVNIATRHQHMFRQVAVLAGARLEDGEILLMSNGMPGSAARIGMLGSSGATALLLASSGTANLPVPGIAGNLLLDPAGLVALPPRTVGPVGYETLQFSIPTGPGLSGQWVYWQLLHGRETGWLLGNRQDLLFR